MCVGERSRVHRVASLGAVDGIPRQEIDTNFDTTSLSNFILGVFEEFAKDLALAILRNPAALTNKASAVSVPFFLRKVNDFAFSSCRCCAQQTGMQL